MMRALTVVPGHRHSARLEEVPEPPVADARWPAQLITRRVPVGRWREALEPGPDDVKVVIDFTA
jgi:hypothetical protein